MTYDVADLHDAKEWQKIKNKKFILIVTDDQFVPPIMEPLGNIVTIMGTSIEDIEERLGAYERHMERILSNHIEA